MRRSIVLSLPLQLVFPGHSIVKDGKNIKNKSVGFVLRRRDIHFNDNRQNDIQQKGLTLQNVLLTVLAKLQFLCCYAEYRYAVCQRYADKV
jgi:hypothetical protein